MKKSWLISLALVLALAVAGFSFAAWTEAIDISGTVNTGDIDPVFTAAFTNDDGTVDNEEFDPLDDGTDPGYDKNVASKTASISEDGKTVTCTITNGYPCYSADTFVEITNDGSVPITITGVVVEAPEQVTVTTAGIEGQTIDPGYSIMGVIHQHVAEQSVEGVDAEELSTYTYTVTITSEQWNTVPVE